MNDYVSISRDPFARHDVVRRLVETKEGCKWCGYTRPSGRLFQYGVERDDTGGAIWRPGLFCSIGCHNCYHD